MKSVLPTGANARNIADMRKDLYVEEEMTFSAKLADPYLRAVFIGAVVCGVVGIGLLILSCILE